ncbi:hypothetical protein M8J76_013506 [Diaphorina citri]|nr:hypothetical protein M8J75_011981 [Diaphorina citri]KAI5733585.1 hypothetical protein M8J76_013506 [Diaphorina citri]
MDQDLLELNKGVEVLLFDLNDNNDDYYILQSQSLIKTWCESNISSKLIGGHKLDVKIAIRDGKQIRGDIEKRIESEPDILFVFGGTELIHGHVTSEVCTGLIQKRITGIEFIIYSVVKSNPDLVLDQFVCGFCRKTLILTLPLVTKDTLSVLNQIQKVLKHALAVYHNDLPSVREKHGESLVVSTASAPPLKSKINRDVTQRSRKSLYPMLEVEAAQKLILDFIETNKCGQQKQSLSCRQAGGYIVAETTVAKDDLPPFDASIKDGYAVIASDGAGKRKVVGERCAGPVKSASPLKSSQCYRINTGAPIPPGADSVVQVEDTELSKGKDGEEVEIKILKTPTKGQDIRVKGIDIRKGATILEEGNLIGPPELGLLASVGVTNITVYKKPIIHILSTGNELDEPDAHVLKPGCIRDSNRTVLASLLSENGFSSVDKGICRDDPDLLLQCLKSNLASCDVIISTGSVSMGDKDYLKDILVTDLGASIHFGRVNMKPGKPTTFATLGNKLIFCLPGNPVSAMVTCHLFVLPALKALAGSSHPSPALLKAKLTADLSLDPERPEYHRVSLHYNPSEEHLLAYSTGHQLSSKLLSCKSCNGFAILPKATTKKTLEKNSLVNVILTKALY